MMRACGRHLGIVAAGVALAALCVQEVGAQAKAKPRTAGPVTAGHTVPMRKVPMKKATPVSTPPAVLPTTTAPRVVVESSTPSPTVVIIPVPDAIPAAVRVTYTVTPLIDGAAIGKLTGALAPAAPGGRRNVLFAVRTPRQLAAGEVQLALVRFSTGSAAVEVPVVAQVGPVRDIRIAPATTLGAARAGSPFTIAYRLTNLGNAQDTVTVQVVAPTGWRVLDPGGDRPFALPMHVTLDRRTQVISPEHADGIATIRLVVLARGVPVAETQLDVQLLGTAVAVGSSGAKLTLGAAMASGPWGDPQEIQTVELEGALTDGVLISARGSTAPWRQGGAAYAFSRANILSAPPSLQLSSAAWRFGAGTLGATISDLSGVNLVGRGANLVVTQPGWNATAIAADPDLGFRNATGSLLGGRIEATPGRFALSTAVTRLREARGQTRELDSWSLGTGWNDLFGGRLAGEVARRQYDGTNALGWSTTYSRRAPGDNLDLRFVRAPGGTRAFARAANELTAGGSHRLNRRLSVIGGYWQSSDEGIGSLSSLTIDGWSLGTNVVVGDGVNASLGARTSNFGAATAIGDFGSGERALEASLDARNGKMSAMVTLSAANLSRTTMLGDAAGDRYLQEAPRAGVRALVSTGDARGSISLTGQYDRTGAGIGFAPVQWSYGIQVVGAIVPGVGDGVRLNGAAERFGGFADGLQPMTLRAGLEVDLPFSALLTLSAERNPYLLVDEAGGQGAWMYVLGLSRSVRLPRLSRSGTRGVVYKDLNGNGERDSGEPGFPGVVLRRGTDMAMTDGRGVFTLSGAEGQSYEVDARSIPVGWLTRSTVVAPGTRAIGVISVSPLIVDLALEAADSARPATSDLADVMVIARDSTGHEWLARRASRTAAVFDALPPGRYTIEIDATAAREPLRATEDLPVVLVTSGRQPPPVRIVLRARSLRFSTPPSRRQ